MSVEMNEIADKILSKNIDKQEALRNFQKLSEEEKDLLTSQLKVKLSGDDALKNKLSAKAAGSTLKAIDQRNLTEEHQNYIEQLNQEYEKFVPESKKNIAKHQHYFVDQRRPFHLIKDLKKLHFQITYQKAEGAYVYDIDGNKYVDISGDMGVNLFGHKPEFIINAVKDSLDQGIPLAGYSEKIFETSKLFSEITGHERVLFTQSGTEAVMFAVRIARAATNKKKIVIFEGSYHGLSDAVTAMSDQHGRSLAMGPGMLQEFAEQIIVLEYGNMEHLDIIEAHADEIACVLVEPVQSRHPYIQPVEFLKEVRKLTLEKNMALIFDEMITGFRISHRGAQGYFNIKADIATYGKIPGGGLPTGVIAGSPKYMDLVDGGTWNLDDDTMPKSKRTGMAGTHSQNPLKIASVYATLSEIKKRCKGDLQSDNCQYFQKELNAKTKYLVENLNAFFLAKNLPITIDDFGSLFRFRFIDSYWGITEALFFILLRMKGIETNIQGNCFLTTAHTDDDIEFVIKGVKESLETLIAQNFFCEVEQEEQNNTQSFATEHHLAPSKNVATLDNLRQNNFGQSASVGGQKESGQLESSQVSSGQVNNEQIEKLMNLIKADLQNFQEEQGN
ncbi:aspartate aminotransferase family protein [Aliikangiella coralliicola]|nr:aminotransferase class III-fold pyridoxal phosphate-dependent enzyme [Aliikangiella coralliicola]